MTRFARAKGSKASNEKTPEDSTPWEVMKEQLLQAKKEKDDHKNREQAEKQRIENYENFLKEHKIQKRKAMWFDFPEAEGNGQKSESPVKKKKKKNKAIKSECGEVAETQSMNETNNTVELNLKKGKKKKKEIPASLLDQNEISVSDSNNVPVQTELNETSTKEVNPKSGKKKKRNKKQKNAQECMEQKKISEIDTLDVNEKSLEKHKKKLRNETNEANEEMNTKSTANKPQKNKIKKLENGKPVRRKDINDKSFRLIINGKEVELVRVDGFPVMKKDADRLQELKANMIQKGIPKSEIQRTMKLERRRAEKALARLKREVCYNCRKGGHNLSDCPDLKSKIPGTEGGEGVCFKCGSTEHRQFECKVQRDKEFRFATCFICKEPGHIARQCPDNPKGLYPNGGSCKLCGDVTHLRKDCPTVSEKKEEKSIKLSTLDSGGDVEAIGQPTNSVASDEPPKKVKKIKF